MKTITKNIGILSLFVIICVMGSSAIAQFGTELAYYELYKPDRNLNPVSAVSMQVFRINELIFDALYSWNSQDNIIPQMAQGMPRLLDDGKSALVMLKSNLLWPDSAEITIDDVLFTFKEKFPNITDTRRRLQLVKDVKPGEAPNSIIFEFSRKVEHPERLLANIFILPKHKMSKANNLREYSEKPMGAGPYMLDKISINYNAYYFIKNPNYGTIAPGRPTIDRTKMIYWWSKAAWVPNILDGLVHILPDMEYNPELSAKPQILPKAVNTNTIAMILINMKDPVLNNVNVRKGLQHLISRNDIYDKQYSGDSTLVLTGPYSLSSHFFDYKVPAWDYNTERAHNLFKDSGLLSIADGKVYDSKTNKQWELSLKTFITAAGERDNLTLALESVDAYLKSSGVRSRIEYLSLEAYLRALKNGDFQLIYTEITFDDNYDIEPYFSTDAINKQGGRNYSRYSNPDVDKAFKDLRRSSVPQQQQQIGKNIHKLLHDDPPAIFLWNLLKWSYVRIELENVSINPFYFFSTIDTWKKKTD